jgi:beta-mannosidase
VHPNDPDRGDRHTWDLKIEACRDMVPRFVSEFGHQAPPTLRSIEEALESPVDRLAPCDLVVRQRAWGGDQVQYAPFLEEWFGRGGDGEMSFERWHWACQLLQARAISIACTWLRANRPRCEGALIWQLNDVWTGHSWSLVDVNHRPKPVFHAVQAAFDPVLLAIEPLGTGLSLVLVNDSSEEVRGEALVRRVDFDGTEIVAETFAFAADPRRGRFEVELPEHLVSPDDPSTQLIVASLGDRRAHWFFAKDQWLGYPEAQFDVTLERSSSTTARLDVEARTLLRDLFVVADRVGQHVCADKGFLTLLPGETASILLSGLEPSDELPQHEQVLRTANELVVSPSDGHPGGTGE